ncbi:MAG: MmgE/PrpD family protein, partial [Dehalococcoidales bacterium]|nr:MmgE/PrpD family protein [Dehalococcoidales bacterium]
MSTEALVRNLIQTKYDDLTAEVIEATKISILDTFGVMLPPSTLTKACISLYEMMNEVDGKKESTLIGFGGRVPCWVAAFVNGSCAHAMDYDDGVTTDKPIQHPTASTFPAALALAERIGEVNGKDFITAVALGNDLSIRIASCPTGNTMTDYPFFPISTFGVFSAAGACGKLLGLADIEMQNALGLALHRVAGTRDAAFAPDSDIRGIRDGFTNKEGVIAALMASKGISACKDSVEQLLRVYYGTGYSLDPLTHDLGKIFRGAEAKYKIWPSCGATHSYIQAALYV